MVTNKTAIGTLSGLIRVANGVVTVDSDPTKASTTTAAMSIYVDQAATGTGTGVDWTNAFTTIQAAIDSLPQMINHAVTIYIRKGAIPYNENITIRRIIGAGSLAIRGEYQYSGNVVTGGTGSFTAATNLTEIVPGDKITIFVWSGTVNASNPSASYEDTVASVSGNVVTLTTNTSLEITTNCTYYITSTIISQSGSNTITIQTTGLVSILGLNITSVGNVILLPAGYNSSANISNLHIELTAASKSAITSSSPGGITVSNISITGSEASQLGINISGMSKNFGNMPGVRINLTGSGSKGILSQMASAAIVSYSHIVAASTGIYAAFNATVANSALCLNGGTTPKTPASSVDGAYIG